MARARNRRRRGSDRRPGARRMDGATLEMASVPVPQRASTSSTLAAMGSRLRELADARASLFALELREEARRGSHLVGLAAAATVLLQLSLLMVAVLVVAVFWDTHRLV